MERFKLRNLYGAKFSYVMTLCIMACWMLYPFSFSWIFPVTTRVFFIGVWALILVWVIFSKIRVKFIKHFFDCYGIVFLGLISVYLLGLTLATFVFNDVVNDYYYFSIISKYIFLLFLIFLLQKNTIYRVYQIYSYLCVLLVVLSLVNIVGMYNGWWWSDVQRVIQGIESPRDMYVSWSGLDGMARVWGEVPNFFRMQSFSIEPAAFAIGLLPALCWEIFIGRSFFRLLILMTGFAATWALGVFLFILLIILFLFIVQINTVNTVRKKNLVFFLGLVFIYVGSHFLLTHEIYQVEQVEQVEQVVGDRSGSFNQRVIDLAEGWEFLKEHPEGAGAGMGRHRAGSFLSVGYMNAAADSGIIGGIFYILGCMFLSIGIVVDLWKNRFKKDKLGSYLYVTGLSVLALFFMGLQRESFDASFYSMWLLASYFIISCKARKNAYAS